MLANSNHVSAQEVIGELSKTLECGICLDMVCNPKQLACNHSFCRSCLDKILIFQFNGSATIKCPNGCDKETSLQYNKTTNDLEINFIVKSVLDLATKHQQITIEGKCSSCSRHPVKYCTACSLFKCGECVDDHDNDDRTELSESFIPIDFNSSEPKGVIMCNEHKSEATHLCCETQYICTYCTHRGDHSKHKYTTLEKTEQTTRDLMRQKLDSNSDHEKRREETEHQVQVGELSLGKELQTRKLKRLIAYKIFLDREEAKVEKEFQQIKKRCLSAFESLSYFKEHTEMGCFPILLEQHNIAKKLKTVYMDSSKAIPGTMVSLVDGSDAYPLGSLETIYCNVDSCEKFRNNFNDKPTEIDVPAVQSLIEYLNGCLPNSKKREIVNVEKPGGSICYEEKDVLVEEKEEKDDKKHEKDENQNVLDVVGDNVLVEEHMEVDDHKCQPKEVVSFPVTKVSRTINCSFQLKNISKAYDNPYSDPVVMGNHIFRLRLQHKTVGAGRIKYAGFYLHCNYQGVKTTWTCQVDLTLTLKKPYENGTHSLSKVYNERSSAWGWPEYVRWCDILDPKKVCLVNDSITLDAVITIIHD